MGVTVESGINFGRAIDLLFIPAVKHFVSVEPMLSPVTTLPFFMGELPPIDWLIAGGESGPGARPMKLEWAEDLRKQCEFWKVPFFFKQVGGNTKINGHWGGDLLDGVRYKKFPQVSYETGDTQPLKRV